MIVKRKIGRGRSKDFLRINITCESREELVMGMVPTRDLQESDQKKGGTAKLPPKSTRRLRIAYGTSTVAVGLKPLKVNVTTVEPFFTGVTSSLGGVVVAAESVATVESVGTQVAPFSADTLAVVPSAKVAVAIRFPVLPRLT